MSAEALDKITNGLPDTWDGYLRGRGRSLRAANRPETTRYNYLLAASQLARYLAEYSPDPEADAAAQNPTEVTRAHIEHFQAWMIDARYPRPASNW
ncbi:phage integrase N-terminal SAM-like domain-containing protein [Kutzneria buriramensis]|uniref:Integrase-like protein n=1 Tax=Kutzneria buriramensis TaxID=1045776 RepID=A0A3E0HIF2_9PSEU|nr:phage integrase N-terminal SAM-like domain-containing protein [Kutzneria buriramensis]REH46188.1 integrase-like protein [Kutzneria buriramensis]